MYEFQGVLVQVLENGQVTIIGCGKARVFTPITVVYSRPLQQSYTPTASSVHRATFIYDVLRRFTKKSNDSLVS